MSTYNIILDLDNTLINSLTFKELKMLDEKHQNKFVYNDMGKYYRVFERPHLQPFLDFVFSNFNVSIWTAASQDYAAFVIKEFILTKPSRKLDFVLFSYHCDISHEMFNCTKDPELIWTILKLPNYSPENTVILDDLQKIYRIVNEKYPNLVVKAKYFDVTETKSYKDKFLEDVVLILKNRFNLT